MKARQLPNMEDYERLTRSPLKGKGGRALVYALTLVLSLLLIFVANRHVSDRLPTISQDHPALTKAKVVELLSRDSSESPYMYEDGSQKGAVQITTLFKAELLDGSDKGQVVEAQQNILSMKADQDPPNLVALGDRVFIARSTPGSQAPWAVYGFERTQLVLLLFAVFALLIVAFGRLKGFNTLVSLLLTCAAVFLVLIPAVLSGHNPYLWTTLTCVYIIVMSQLIINGPNDKALAAGTAAIMGMGVASAIMMIMDKGLKLTGFVSEDSTYLFRINQGVEYDMKAILFCAIMLGATGAVMDVSMDIASSLREIAQTEAGRDMRVLLKSAFEIGRDNIGTMVNTLILAYVGGSFGALLLIVSLNLANLHYLLNSEGMIVEMLQMLIGAFSMLFTIPFAALICSLLYTRRSRRTASGAQRGKR